VLKISAYISELLYEHDCVIVPGLGAFIANYREAHTNETQERIHPPSKEITFSPKLKHNDGLLVNYLSRKEGMPLFDALKKIEEFRENIQYRLEKGEEVVFEGLGALTLNDSKSTVFKAGLTGNLLPDSYGLGMISLKDRAGAKKGQGEQSNAEKNQKKNKAWLLFLLIPFAAIIVFVYLNFFTKNTTEPPASGYEESRIIPERSSTALSDSLASDTVAVDSMLPRIEESAPVVEEKDTVVNYYLVGGSFLEKANADKYFSQIEKMGYSPVHLGKQGRFFVVAVGGFNTLEEANTVRDEFLDRDPDSEVWILNVSD